MVVIPGPFTSSGVAPGPVIDGPPPIGRRPGLFDVASGPLDFPFGGAGGGVRYMSVACGTGRLYPIGCNVNQSIVITDEKILDGNESTFSAKPFIVYSSIACGAAGNSEADMNLKLLQRFSNGEQGAVEHALWTGETESGSGLGITSLADTENFVDACDDGDLVSVIDALETWLYQTNGYGNIGFIHAPVGIASHAAFSQLIVNDSNGVKRTPYGSRWIFAGGYDGTGPDGETPPECGSFIYITGQVTVWRTPDVFVFPGDQVMDRVTNQRELIAERVYAVGFDCFSAAALYNPTGGS